MYTYTVYTTTKIVILMQHYTIHDYGHKCYYTTKTA